MSERRFTEKPDLHPEAVRSLADDHPAMVENRTLFPSTVVTVTQDAPDRLLVSGDNNMKIGKTVEKGEFNGYGIYMLSLEERATCPTDCSVRGFCYGNGMQMARRHRIGDPDTFYDRLALEIVDLLDEHEGLLIRLHVLGDFPSVEYVSFWKEVLDENPTVAVFGYTHRATTKWGGDEIGDAIAEVKAAHPKRFRIRWSSPTDRVDGATVIDYVPDGARSKSGALVCPSQTDATACCATCALCWERGFADKTIAFIKHGPKSEALAAEAAMAAAVEVDLQVNTAPASSQNIASNDAAKRDTATGDRRRVRGIRIPKAPTYNETLISRVPEVRRVVPSTLLVEASYQRDLSGKSMRLIKNIVLNWDWAKFKPPVCAETPDGLFVIDGQHTAIAAASHPGIKEIPVMVVVRPEIEDRAAAFVSQNRDRLAMSPLQIFHAELVAGDKTALGILRCVVKAGASVPRAAPQKGKAQPGEIVSIGGLRSVYDPKKPEHLERVLRIAVLSGKAPINSLLMRGISLALKMEPRDEDLDLSRIGDEEIAWHISRMDVERQAEEVAADAQCNKYDALASLIESGVWDFSEEYQAHWEATRGQIALAS